MFIAVNEEARMKREEMEGRKLSFRKTYVNTSDISVVSVGMTASKIKEEDVVFYTVTFFMKDDYFVEWYLTKEEAENRAISLVDLLNGEKR